MANRAPCVAMLAHTCYLSDPRVRREAETLAEAGMEIHVISLSEKRNGVPEPSKSTVNGVHIHRLPVTRRRGGLLRYMREYFLTGLLGGLTLMLLHFRRRLDIVHVHNMPDILIMAAVVPRLTGSKLILDVHDPMPELYAVRNHSHSTLVRILGFQEKLSCRLADRIISVNEPMRTVLTARGIAAEKVFIVHNFPDLNHFPLSALPSVWPKGDKLVLLYCGTVTEHYDLGLAIKAMADLKREIPIKLIIMGDGNRLTEVLKLASAHQLVESIELINRVPIERVAEEMKRADVGISCHRSGVFGDLYFSTKILEYLSQGLPVVTSRTQTIAKYIPDDCVFYFEPGNAKSLAEAIRLMWKHPEEVLRRLERAMALLATLSWQTEKPSFLSFYFDLLEMGEGGSHVKQYT